MEPIKQISKSIHVGQDRMLTMRLPEDAAGQTAEVVLTYTSADGEERENWHDFVNRTYGILRDDPVERPPELPEDAREPIE